MIEVPAQPPSKRMLQGALARTGATLSGLPLGDGVVEWTLAAPGGSVLVATGKPSLVVEASGPDGLSIIFQALLGGVRRADSAESGAAE